jgi:predicted GNAT family N-acyltransferase
MHQQTLPKYATHRRRESSPERSPSNAPEITIKIAKDMNDLMKMAAVRSAVFMADQVCPYDEEFDGNDFCGAAHLLGFIGGEVAGCIRARFFADFVHLGRLAVLPAFRNSKLPFALVLAAKDLARKKGYRTIYGHSQARYVKFWAHFGAKPTGRKLVFSDFEYAEMVIDMPPDPDPIQLTSDPYIILRPEGAWDIPGVLDTSAARPVTSPSLSAREAA